MDVRWTSEHGMTVRRFGGERVAEAGPEVVWIHGLGEQSASFDAIAQHRLLAGFTHVLPDLPGYGRSPWPAELAPGDSLEALAELLAGWLAGRRPILAGHSMGGVLATLVAERTPVAGIVNIDGNLTRGDCTFSAEAAAYPLDVFRASGFAAMRARVYERGMTEPALRGYHAALTLASPDVFHRNAIDLVALSSRDVLAARLAAIATRVPVLFVAGVPGGICGRSQQQLDQHGVRWVGIAPAGHWPFLDQPDAFAAAMAPVLRAATV
jgi:pimeloyl-ACP methyl ester carboxylesterase